MIETVFDVDKPVVIVALESLPYEVVVADIDVVLVNVGLTILRSDDDLIIAAQGDSVDTLYVETVCVCKAKTKVQLPSVVVLDDKGITVAVFGAESVISIGGVVFGSITITACVAIDSDTVTSGGFCDSVTGKFDVDCDSVTGGLGFVRDLEYAVKSLLTKFQYVPTMWIYLDV